MMKIDKIWKDLEDEQPLKSGLLYKRFSGAVKPDVYVALKSPERLRCIAAHLDASVVLLEKGIDKLRDIKIETLPDEKHPDKQFLMVLLLNNQHKDIFSVLCEDLVQQVADITLENDLIKQLLLRIEKWRLLFEKMGQKGLSEEAQRGLYGELCFLRKFLKKKDDYEFCVEVWKGPERAVQDFQFSNWAVEVKTTYGKNHQKLQIANERQLDTSFVPDIFLYHLSLDVRSNHGETLNEIIDELYEKLRSNPGALNAFRLKLMEANYFDVHSAFYDDTGYTVRQEKIFRVTHDFPKITESQIPSGVGDVRYSLVVSDNKEWTIDEELLFKKLIKD